MPIRHCVCGKRISVRVSLCHDCIGKYGSIPSNWPEWVSFLVSDERKETLRECRHDFDYQVFDESQVNSQVSDLAEHNLKRAKKHPEMEFEDFLWFNQ